MSWRQTLTYKVGFRRAQAGVPFKCPWWADELVYGLAYLRGRGVEIPKPKDIRTSSDRPEKRWMWLLLQCLIIFAVIASNIHWHWTPNIYIAAILGWIAALLVTVGLNGLFGLIRRWKV